MTTTRSPVKRLSLLGIFTALAMIFSYLETLLPLPLPLPGFKLGLCNVVVLLCAYTLGLPSAAALSLLRVFLTALLFGNVTSFFFSLTGALFALASLVVCKKLLGKRISFVGASVFSAAAFNTGQIAAACCLYTTLSLLSYLPALLCASVLLGGIIGLLLNLLSGRLSHLFSF